MTMLHWMPGAMTLTFGGVVTLGRGILHTREDVNRQRESLEHGRRTQSPRRGTPEDQRSRGLTKE